MHNVLRARPVLETSTEGHLLLPYPPVLAQSTGKEKACKMIRGQWVGQAGLEAAW